MSCSTRCLCIVMGLTQIVHLLSSAFCIVFRSPRPVGYSVYRFQVKAVPSHGGTIAEMFLCSVIRAVLFLLHVLCCFWACQRVYIESVFAVLSQIKIYSSKCHHHHYHRCCCHHHRRHCHHNRYNYHRHNYYCCCHYYNCT